jgi:hypothetical protein
MPAADPFSSFAAALGSPVVAGFAVTPHDTNELPTVTRAVYVGGAGALKVDMANGDTLTFAGVPAGTLLPFRVKKVHATGTSATSIIGLY